MKALADKKSGPVQRPVFIDTSLPVAQRAAMNSDKTERSGTEAGRGFLPSSTPVGREAEATHRPDELIRREILIKNNNIGDRAKRRAASWFSSGSREQL